MGLWGMRPDLRRSPWSAGEVQETGNWVIEAWRGVAAWMVVYAHYWAFSGSDWPALRLAHTGVDLFFVLSGFVFAPYLTGTPLQAGPFLVRRFFRIYPAYALALAVYVAMKAASGQELRYLWEHLSFLHVQSREMAFYYNPPFWSLPSEVEFYMALALAAPIMVQISSRWGKSGLALALTVLGLVAVGTRWALGWASDPNTEDITLLALYHLPGVMVEFLMGVGAWTMSRRSLSRGTRVGLFVIGLGLWWTLAAWFGRVGDTGLQESWARGIMGMLAAGCFALMVCASAGNGNWTEKPGSLGMRLALWAGRLSYGVYLFHIAALKAAQWAAPAMGWGPASTRSAAVALTLLTAWLTYTLWENPCRLWGRRLAKSLEVRQPQRTTLP
jgi:peptidoglycan/LPS O-acetylase OafA/YrhL